jgi:hypothetical protein
MEDLRKELSVLRDMVRRLDEMNTIENVLEQGFEKVAHYLEPLRDISPQRTRLKDAETRNLLQIQASLSRPDWRDAQPPIGTDPYGAEQTSAQRIPARRTAS